MFAIVLFIAFTNAANTTTTTTTAARPVVTSPSVVSVRPDGWRDDWAWRDGWRGDWGWDARVEDPYWGWQNDLAWRGAYDPAWTVAAPVTTWAAPATTWAAPAATWAAAPLAGTWDPAWRGDAWAPETVSVREVPSTGRWANTDWHNADAWASPVAFEAPWGYRGDSWIDSWDGPWDRPGFDGPWDLNDRWGVRGAPIVSAARPVATVAAPVRTTVAAPAKPVATTATTTTAAAKTRR